MSYSYQDANNAKAGPGAHSASNDEPLHNNKLALLICMCGEAVALLHIGKTLHQSELETFRSQMLFLRCLINTHLRRLGLEQGEDVQRNGKGWETVCTVFYNIWK